ncbi:hypothetical protein MPH_02133 [Macrophomina phaseolina MS6]|uniref:Short-chain dehydrogenase/reductase SDR n=1 Tax=Macrophomina phaseolina (strain MS6) TaxID=1126212 RepID=K2RDL8_MACPH|nr:hypothetical protein MPH_02133 [Macrophomina phaseolina MS6]
MLTGSLTGLYSASKSALQSLSETLRLELQPLGVRVVTAVTGSVKSNVFANGPPLRLPAGSLYAAAEHEIAARAAGMDVERDLPQTLEQYSRNLVADVLGGASGKVYRGKHASTVDFLASWLPAFLFDWISLQDSGLEKVGRPKQL